MALGLAVAARRSWTWRVVRGYCLTASSAVALALAAAVGSGAWVPNEARDHGASARAVRPLLLVAPSQPSVTSVTPSASITFYLVGSQAQADRVRAGHAEVARQRWLFGVANPQAEVVVLLADTPAAASLALQVVAGARADASEAATSVVEVVDLRDQD